MGPLFPPHFRTECGVFIEAHNGMCLTDIYQFVGLKMAVFSLSNTATLLKGIRDRIVAKGLVPIEIDGRPDDDSGFRKLAAGRVDSVYSNRERGCQVVEVEGLTADVSYAGGHRAIPYCAGFTRSLPDQGLIDNFNAARRQHFRGGEAQKIIESYGLERSEVE